MHTYLDKIFGSRLRAKLIGWLFSHTEEKFFVTQLAELLDEKTASISRELSRLNLAGILLSSRQGKRKNYRANPSFFFFPELKRLVLKTVGVPGQLSQLLTHLSGVRHAFLYGPYGRGDEEVGSDIELMIIGDIDCDMLDELLEGLERRLDLTINCIVYGPEEFDEKVKAGNRFLLDVLEDDFIMLIGRRDDLVLA